MNNYIRNKCEDKTVGNHGNGKEFWDIVKPLISHKCNNRNDNILLLKNNEVFTNTYRVAPFLMTILPILLRILDVMTL